MLTIKDLSVTHALDHTAMSTIRGGEAPTKGLTRKDLIPSINFDFRKSIDVVNAVAVDFDFNHLFGFRKTVGVDLTVGE